MKFTEEECIDVTDAMMTTLQNPGYNIIENLNMD
jgi:hypothetical protein